MTIPVTQTNPQSQFSNQLHDIKHEFAIPADFDLFFGPTGDVWNPVSGDLLGTIVHSSND